MLNVIFSTSILLHIKDTPVPMESTGTFVHLLKFPLYFCFLPAEMSLLKLPS